VVANGGCAALANHAKAGIPRPDEPKAHPAQINPLRSFAVSPRQSGYAAPVMGLSPANPIHQPLITSRGGAKSGGRPMPSSYASGEHFERFIGNQVAEGRYASAAEVVRNALRLLDEAEQQRAPARDTLREEIGKGFASGEGKSADEIPARLERRYRGLAART